jgi:hypothetical protein
MEVPNIDLEAATPPPGGCGHPNDSPEPGRKERHPMSDFDESANDLWTLYRKEARRNDESQLQSLTDDMNGVLIFVRSLFPHAYKSCCMLIHGPIGGFIFRCPYRIRN